ncbi:unnamed protein product [Ostreobium quekettii]|uniref:Large ribosomal subunit protein uL18c n=1 Tax=Ostreobium quekettii TaxID=121088 RepID=A0A8S1IVA6_9CHLO|nr:unnamed protein product [Ostreobium quekettii]
METRIRSQFGSGCDALVASSSCAPRPAVGRLQIVAKTATPREQRILRHRRIRAKLSGTPERPRLCVFRSNNHIYAQVIDDIAGHTLCAACTLTKGVKEETGGKGNNKDAAFKVGKLVAERCLEKGVSQVCFDRAGYLYHGRVQAVADGAREAGLQF